MPDPVFDPSRPFTEDVPRFDPTKPFQEASGIQTLNPTEPSLEGHPTFGGRLRGLPVVGEVIQSLLGPEVQNPNIPVQGVLPAISQVLLGGSGRPGVLQASPAMLLPEQPRSYGEAVEKGVLEQVNPLNIGLGGGLTALHGVKEAGVLGNALKALIATYFAKQGAEMIGGSLGERTAGVPLAPEKKGELDVNTLMGLLMTLAPAALKEPTVKPTDVSPPSANLTIPDIEQIEGRVPTERRLTQFNPTLATRGPTDLGVRPGQVPFRGLEQYPPAEEQRVVGAGPLVEKRASQQVPQLVGRQPVIGQNLVGPPEPMGPIEPATQTQGEPKLGGQISFASPAEAGSIPNARQATSGKDVSTEQERLMRGQFVPQNKLRGMQLKPTEEQLKQRGQEGAINIEPLKEVAERFKSTLDVLGEAYQRKNVKGDIAALSRAVDGLSLRAQTQAENHMKLTATKWFGNRADAARNAMFAVLEGGKTGGLARALAKSAGNKEAEASVRFAMDPKNQRGLNEMVSELRKLDQQNLALAKANGISVPSIEDYLKHMYAKEPRPFFFTEKPSPGIGMGSKLARQFPTIFDAIKAGHKPASLDVAALVGKRTQEIFREVQTKKWLDGFRTVLDPVTKEPVVTDLAKMGLPPEGYTKVEGMNVAVKDGYKSIFKALTGESHVSDNMVGQALLEAEGGIKHGTLAFDVFHLSRVAQFARSVNYKVGYKKGLSLLEYSSSDLNEAVKQGLAPKEAVTYQSEVNNLPQGKFTNRQLGSLAIQQGANMGKHSEALYTSFVRSFPGLKQTVGRFNRFTFDKVSRGAMYEANVADIKRIAEARPDLTIQEVARKVSTDLNYRLGNISKQGLVKGKTLQDITQLVFLAPKWVESMGQSEARSMGQVGKSLLPGEHLGTLGFSSAKLLATYLLATQAINVIFNGHATFQNPNNKGHEIDAYIPPITKNGKGFWISPLSVVGELEHDMLRYSRGSKEKGTGVILDAAAQITKNKLSPPMGGLLAGISGRNWKDEPVKGWDRIKEALVTGVNPTPLPIKQAAQAIKEKDIAPLERQAFSFAGVKAEPESFGEVKQRKIQGLGKASLSDRAKLEKEFKTLRPTSTDEARLASGQRKMEDILRNRNALKDSLPKDIQSWLGDKNLHITGFSPEVTKNKQRVTLTEPEQEYFMKELTKQYTQFLKPWVGQDTTQEKLNSRLTQARNRARKNLIDAIESNSIVESNKPKKKRFSFMGE